MTDRRQFIKRTLIPAGALCLPSVLHAHPLSVGNARVPEHPLSTRLRTLTRDTVWTLITGIKIGFKTHHCQGMVKIGDEFWVSSVEMGTTEDGLVDRSTGKGHLFRISIAGRLVDDISIGEGSIFHPGGIDFDGEHIWIAAAEYRPDSQAIIYRFDPSTKELKEMFRWQDHIGAIARNKDSNTLHGISWGSRKFYKWELDDSGNVPLPLAAPADTARLNHSFYIDYQDNQCLGGREMLYTGLSVYKRAGGQPLAIGGLEIVDLEKGLAMHQVAVQLWAPVTGVIMTQNPSFFELMPDDRLRAYFMPEDNESTIYVYEA
ncbi:MAG TPA: DUF6454 family protein [Puia sp.]